jgi:hypothetical protein
MYAAEARGDVPKGTAKKWAHDTPNIKGLPEKVMEKNAMFFKNQKPVEDGMFMKRAEDLKPPEKIKPTDPNKPDKAEDQMVRPGDAVKGAQLPIMDRPPKQVTNSMMGIPKKATSMEDVADTAKNVAEHSGMRLMQTGSALMHGTKKTLEQAPEQIDKALKYVENLPPAAQAALVGGTGYLAAKRVGKGISGLAGLAGGAKKATTMQRLLEGLKRLKGR